MFFGRFIATLSSGQVVYEKFPKEVLNAPPEVVYMGWGELVKYCRDSSLKIVGMKIRFRSVTHCCVDHAEEYFVNMSVSTIVGGGGATLRGFGFRVKRKLFINWLDRDGRIVTMEVRSV